MSDERVGYYTDRICQLCVFGGLRKKAVNLDVMVRVKVIMQAHLGTERMSYLSADHWEAMAFVESESQSSPANRACVFRNEKGLCGDFPKGPLGILARRMGGSYPATRSNTAVSPCPPPIHIVSMP